MTIFTSEIIEDILNLNICPPFLSFVSISSVRSLMWYQDRWGPDKAVQLVPFANNFPSFSFSYNSLSRILCSCVPARIIITMVETTWQTTHREILGILDCCENKLRPLTNEKLCCFKIFIHDTWEYLFIRSDSRTSFLLSDIF